jgi:uncharacterized protein YfcZ (UPF0381/DUF406 family)
MAQVPAFCESCGSFFTSNNMIGGNVTVTFKGCSVTCRCGAVTTIVDGTYQFTGNTFRLLKSSGATSTQLKRLLEILEKAKANNSSSEEIAQTIKKEIPELNSFSSLLPKTRTELYTILGVLIATIALYYNHLTYKESTKPKDEKPKVQVNNFYYAPKEKTKAVQQQTSSNHKSTSRKIGVNQSCVCGSGIKTKKCPCSK